jgi:outer membrane protein OmpU
MNKLKTIGLSALAGSLAVATASNAVEYALTGDAYVSYSSEDSTTTETASGKHFAADMDLYTNASAELDNGFTVSFYQGINTNSTMAVTSAQVTLGMGSLGTLQLNEDFGSKANAIDDVMPNAMQETWDRVADINITDPSFFGSATAQGSVDYRIPTLELGGMSVNASFTYDPAVSEESSNASSGGLATSVGGNAIVLELSGMGLTLGLGQENLDNGFTAGGDTEENTTGYIKFAQGPISVGYQEAYANERHGPGNTATVGRDNESEFWGIAYTAGDISLSYAESEYTNLAIGSTAASLTQELEAIQASYTMGAMTIMASLSEGSNIAATASGAAGQNYEETSIAVNFSF